MARIDRVDVGAGLAPVVEDGVSVLRAPLLPDVPLQMIAVADIGSAAAAVLIDPERLPGGAIEIAGEKVSAERVAGTFGRNAGLPARFEPLPISVLGDDDQEAMFAWFQHFPAYTPDVSGTRAIVSGVMNLERFVTTRDQA